MKINERYIGIDNIEYIAGFFDADGSVGIYKYKKNDRDYYRLKIVFINTNKKVLEYIQNSIKSKDGSLISQKPTKPHHKQKYNLIYSEGLCKRLIPKLIEHSIVKKKQLEVALEFLAIKTDCGPNSEEVNSKREELKEKIRILKKDQ